MRRNFVSEILERLQYLFIIGLATILALYYALIVTRPSEIVDQLQQNNSHQYTEAAHAEIFRRLIQTIADFNQKAERSEKAMLTLALAQVVLAIAQIILAIY